MNWVLTDRHSHAVRPISFERADSIEKTIKTLHTTLAQRTYILTGGLALSYLFRIYGIKKLLAENVLESAGIRGFYRDHDAIHLAAYRSDVPSILEHMHPSAYRLVKRKALIGLPGFGKKIDTYTPPLSLELFKNPSEAAKNAHNLRLMKVEPRTEKPEPITRFDSYVDLFVHDKETSQEPLQEPREILVRSYDDNLQIPLIWFQPIPYKEYGTPLLIGNPAYLFAIKARCLKRSQQHNRPAHEKDITDISILEKLLEYVGEKPREILECLHIDPRKSIG